MKAVLKQNAPLTVVSEDRVPFTRHYPKGTTFKRIQDDSVGVVLVGPEGETVFVSSERFEQVFGLATIDFKIKGALS